MKRKHTAKKKKRGPGLGGIVLLLASALAICLAAVFLKGGEPRLPDEGVVGIDVSHYQKQIDYSRLSFNFSLSDRTLSDNSAQGCRAVDFVVAKATEGVSYRDRYYSYNRSECRRRGIPFGAYHYFKPLESPTEQARNFISTASLVKGDMVPVVDVEEWGHLTMAQLKGRVLSLCEALEKQYGRKPVIYCNLAYYYLYFCNPSFKDYSFWIAAYSRRFILADHIMWQTTDKAVLSGISEKVDLDFFDGTMEEFKEKMIL